MSCPSSTSRPLKRGRRLKKDYRCVAEAPGKKAEVLAKIDDLMEVALKGTGEKNRRQP